MVPDFDIIVAGGGIAGMTATAAFGGAGYKVLCIDPAPPITTRDAAGADLRTTAILQPGRALLEHDGLWPRLAPYATPLETMRIIDASDKPVIRDFDASDVSDLPFGWNLPNWLLRRELLAQLESLPDVTFRAGLAATGYHGRGPVAKLRLSDGSTATARLVVAADGRDSVLRQAAGIDIRKTRYGQKALAFAVCHDQPHDNVSTEIHKTGGPFTLVPLPDHNGQPCSAVVWMDDGPLQTTRCALPETAFDAEITARSLETLGPLRLASRRTLWPIISQRATRLAAPRLALMAEAAHVVPPIGAQGLNMSLKDIETLCTQIAQTPEDPGAPAGLLAYERARLPDIRARVTGIDLLNRASQVTSPLLRNARASALSALHSVSPVRRTLMQLGLGTKSIG